MTYLNYLIPTHFVPALINDDPSGLSDGEEKELEQFLNTLLPGYFTLGNQVEPEFYYRNDVNNLGDECLELPYILL